MLKTSTHQEVLLAHGIVSAFGTKMHICLYAIDGLLIDTGPSRLKESVAFFNTIDINQVAITHVHEDHSGMASWLEANKKATIYLSDKSLAYAQEKAKLPFYRTLVWGKRLPFNPISYPHKINTDKYTFDVINTPGHADDHVTLLEKNKGWLFTGDLFLSTKPVVCLKGENIPNIISSLQNLCQLDFDTFFCAHSGIHHENAKEKLQKRLDFFVNLTVEAEELYSKGLTVQQIDKKLFPKKLPIYYVSSGEWSSFNIVNSIINDK